LVERELERLGARSVRPERGLQVGYERVDVTAAIDMCSLPTRGVYSRRRGRVTYSIGTYP
jgi:hypothetical protein